MAVVYNHFPQIAAGMTRELKKAVKEVASSMVDDMVVAAPEDTAFLASTIYARGLTWSVFSKVKYRGTPYQLLHREAFPLVEAPASDFEAFVAVGATYGIYPELGTRYMGAQPYFYPSVETGGQYLDFQLSLIPGALGSIGAL